MSIRRLKLLLPMMALLLGLAGTAHAQAASSATPNPETTPALAPFMKEPGTHAYFMGQESNLNGWFITMTQNRVQVAYTSLDGQRLIIGAIFGADGSNVTEAQLVRLREHEPAVNQLFTNTVEQAKQQLVKSSGMDRILKNLDPKSKGDMLYIDLAQMFRIQVGSKDAPLLFMVVDPNCPHCKHAWKDLQPLLEKTKLQVRLLPLGILGPESTRMAAMLLDQDNPTPKWNAFAAANFDPKVLDGAPGETGVSKEKLNRAFFDKWKLRATPFFAYRSKSGEIKVLNETPKDMAALVADIAPLPEAGADPVVAPSASSSPVAE